MNYPKFILEKSIIDVNPSVVDVIKDMTWMDLNNACQFEKKV